MDGVFFFIWFCAHFILFLLWGFEWISFFHLWKNDSIMYGELCKSFRSLRTFRMAWLI